MHIFFLDDSRQTNPTRPKIGAMVAVGGLVAEAVKIPLIESELDKLCSDAGFPAGEIFKWSPGREHWMRTGLIDQARTSFQVSVIDILSEHGCRAVFVAEDSTCDRAENSSLSSEIDVVKLMIERVDWFFSKKGSNGLMIIDRLSGDHHDEEEFLAECLQTIEEGTTYLKPGKILMAALSLPNRLSRLLQAADLITSATLAYVAGEHRFSPPVVEAMKPLFIRETDRVGGVGVKLHPWRKFANLYHWLFDDSHYWRGNSGLPLPIPNIAFAKSPEQY